MGDVHRNDPRVARIRQLELEVQALRGSLKATREAKTAGAAAAAVPSDCKTCDGLRRLLASATKVLEERERHIGALEQRIEDMARAGSVVLASGGVPAQDWECAICGTANPGAQPHCSNRDCGSPERPRADPAPLDDSFFPDAETPGLSQPREARGGYAAPAQPPHHHPPEGSQAYYESLGTFPPVSPRPPAPHDTPRSGQPRSPQGSQRRVRVSEPPGAAASAAARRERVRVVQCGMCRHILTAPAGSIVGCPNCSMEISVPHAVGA